MSALRSHIAESVAQSELAAALAELRASLELPDGVPARGARRGGGRDIRFAAARTRPARPRVRHDRPGRVDGPRPGPAPRASRRRLRGALRDRGCPGLRSSRAARSTSRPARRGQTLYAADGRVPLHPPGAQRGSRLAAAGRRSKRLRLGARPRRGGRGRAARGSSARSCARASDSSYRRGAGAHRRR